MRMAVLISLLVAIFIFPMSATPAQVIRSGTIQGQSVKWTTGSVRIVKTSSGHEIRLGSNFKTKRGPSLWVYLGNDRPEKRIGKLQSISGAQSYVVPANIHPGDYSRLFIHCVPFNATFGFAKLR